MTDLTILPVGNDFGKLTQRDAGHEATTRSHTLQFIDISGESGRDTNRNQLVHHILFCGLIGILSFHLHVNVVVTLPSCADSETIAIAEGHLQFYILIRDTQSAGLLVVDLDTGGSQRLQHVAAYEHQFWHLAKDLDNAVGIGFQFTEVIALQTHLDGHSTSAETQLFDFHVCLWEHLTVFLRTLINQLYGGFIARGIDDELRITLISKLWSI